LSYYAGAADWIAGAPNADAANGHARAGRRSAVVVTGTSADPSPATTLPPDRATTAARSPK
jgi:hypothetical protein